MVLHCRVEVPRCGQGRGDSLSWAIFHDLSVAELSDRVKKITDQFQATIPVEIMDTVADIPRHANSTDVAGGTTTNDRIYLVREGLRADSVEITVFQNTLLFASPLLYTSSMQ